MAKEYEEVSNQICKNINNQMCEKLTTPFTRYAALRVVKEHHFQDPDLKHYYKEVHSDQYRGGIPKRVKKQLCRFQLY